MFWSVFAQRLVTTLLSDEVKVPTEHWTTACRAIIHAGYLSPRPPEDCVAQYLHHSAGQEPSPPGVVSAFSRVRGTEPPVERVRPRIRIRTSRKLLSPETTIHPLSFLFARRVGVSLILLKGITYHTNFQYTELTQEYITSFCFPLILE